MNKQYRNAKQRNHETDANKKNVLGKQKFLNEQGQKTHNKPKKKSSKLKSRQTLSKHETRKKHCFSLPLRTTTNNREKNR